MNLGGIILEENDKTHIPDEVDHVLNLTGYL